MSAGEAGEAVAPGVSVGAEGLEGSGGGTVSWGVAPSGETGEALAVAGVAAAGVGGAVPVLATETATGMAIGSASTRG